MLTGIAHILAIIIWYYSQILGDISISDVDRGYLDYYHYYMRITCDMLHHFIESDVDFTNSPLQATVCVMICLNIDKFILRKNVFLMFPLHKHDIR